MDYWKECIAEAFEDAGITATDDQIGTVASWAEGAHDNYSQAHGYDCIPNPARIEADELKRKLEAEKRKVVCPACRGRGRIIDNDPGSGRSSDSECWKCRGEGKVPGR